MLYILPLVTYITLIPLKVESIRHLIAIEIVSIFVKGVLKKMRMASVVMILAYKLSKMGRV